MKFIYIISFLLLSTGLLFVLGINPTLIGSEISIFLQKKKTIRKLAQEYSNKKQFFLVEEFSKTRNTLFQMGKEHRFNISCYFSILMVMVGIAVSFILDNLIITIVLPIFLALIPFVFVKLTIASYEKKIQEDMETSLSIITTSYTRSLDIVAAIEENLPYLRPPIKDMFSSFVIETTMISSDMSMSLDNLKQKIDNDVFKEWCEIIKACQSDKSLVDMLLPTVSKLTDIRIVNNDLKTILVGARREFLFMVLLVFLNFPIIYFINKDWFNILINTIPGKIVIGVSICVVLVTSFLAFRITKPIEYKK